MIRVADAVGRRGSSASTPLARVHRPPARVRAASLSAHTLCARPQLSAAGGDRETQALAEPAAPCSRPAKRRAKEAARAKVRGAKVHGGKDSASATVRREEASSATVGRRGKERIQRGSAGVGRPGKIG